VMPPYGPDYSGTWTFPKNKDAFEGTQAGTRDNNAPMTFRFKGTSIEIKGTKGPNHGRMQIFLGDELVEEVDCYAPAAESHASLFKQDGFRDGIHELRIVALGRRGKRNPASTDGWVSFDEFVVNGISCGAMGLPMTPMWNADAPASVYVDFSLLTDDTPIPLQRRPTHIQVNLLKPNVNKNFTVTMAHPFDSAPRPLGAPHVTPMTPGGFTIENVRSTFDYER